MTCLESSQTLSGLLVRSLVSVQIRLELAIESHYFQDSVPVIRMSFVIVFLKELFTALSVVL